VERSRRGFFTFLRSYGFKADRVSRRLAVCVVLVAWAVTWTGLMQEPIYKASALILVGWQQAEDQWPNWGGSGEQLQTLEYRAQITQPMVLAIDSRIVAAETIERLDLPMEPAQLLHNLSVKQFENTDFIALSYEDTDPQRAKLIVKTVGEVASEFASDRSSEFSVDVWEKAVMPTTPVSPNPWRNGLIVLVAGLALSGMLTHSLPRSLAAEAALIADNLVEHSKYRAGQALTVIRTRLVAPGVPP